MAEHVLVWDIETVPDIVGYARASGMTGAGEADVRAAMGEGFAKLIYHAIICIGAVRAHREPSGTWIVDAIGAPHVGERTEKQLIAAFVERIAEFKPRLVTFNGQSFDLPVLRYRAMIHEIAAPGLAARPYFSRYAPDSIDLCDVLASYSPKAKAALDELCRIMGLPGKPDGIHGGEVERYFRDGRIVDIAAYCESDVINTYRLWLRYELFRGDLDADGFAASESNLAQFLER